MGPGGGACRCTVPEITSTTMMVWLPNDCGLGTAVLFTVPAAYLGANPEGEVSVMLTAGTNSLRTTIAYTRVPQPHLEHKILNFLFFCKSSFMWLQPCQN